MHRLLSASPQLTSTLSWETSYPMPFPGERPDAAERKRRARERMELFLLELAPEFADIHDVVWDGPEEDVILRRPLLRLDELRFVLLGPTYGDWLRDADQSTGLRRAPPVVAGAAVAAPGARRTSGGC
jgi:hypothetical protein